jgi:hypothetical protein
MERSLDVPPFAAGELPPRKVAWLHPQLIRTACHAWLSTVAAEYLDRRETPLRSTTFDRQSTSIPTGRHSRVRSSTHFCACFQRRVWIDYVSDIGDSWEATYAVLSFSSPEAQGARSRRDG